MKWILSICWLTTAIWIGDYVLNDSIRLRSGIQSGYSADRLNLEEMDSEGLI